MPGRTALTPQVPVGGYPTLPVTALSLNLAFASDQSNGNSVVSTGRELILAWNQHATLARTITITSIADGDNRSGDITAYSIAAATIACFGPVPSAGWAHGGLLYLDCSTSDIKFAVLQLPAVS